MGFREIAVGLALLGFTCDLMANVSPSDNLDYIPPIGSASYELILHHEVSSRRFYDRIYARPSVPGGESGVTIGIGYDLGYKSKARFTRDWGKLLSSEEFQALQACLGKTGSSARKALKGVIHITIPWEKAEFVFRNYSLPDAIADTLYAFPSADKLPPDAFGALVSLVFNRGANVGKSRRRAEMRQIRELVATGRYIEIPQAIRDMKRIWAGTGLRGLLRRREDEAKLIEVALRGSPQHLTYFDMEPGDLQTNPEVQGTLANGLGRPRIPQTITQADAEEIRSYIFQHAETVALSLAARIEAAGDRHVTVLKVDSREDMLWVAEFRDLVITENNKRVFENEEIGKFVKVDLTGLDYNNYPPSEVNRILALTQNLLRIQIPSPLLAQWSGDQKNLPVGNTVQDTVINTGRVRY